MSHVQDLGSGHGCGKKFLYAMNQFAPFVISFQIGGARDLYTLNWGADPTTIAEIFLCVAFWNPINDAVIGWMQDKEVLNSCFSKDKWGRRAQWYLTHLLVGAFVVILTYSPYALDISGNDLHVLFAFAMFVAYWAFSCMWSSSGAALIEIYPFNEERIVVESYQVVTAILGVFVGVGIYLMVLASDSMALIGGVLGGLLSCISLLAVPRMMEAKRPVDDKSIKNYWGEVYPCLKNKAYQMVCASQFFDGAKEGLRTGFFVNYFMYVAEVEKKNRSLLVGVTVVMGCCLQIAVAPMWAAVFKKPLNTRTFSEAQGTIFCKSLEILVAPIIFLALPSLGRTVGGFLLSFCFSTLGASPRTFWVTSVRGWIVDEDVQSFSDENLNKRKEGTYYSLQSSFRNFGNTLIFALCLLYMASGAGQVSINCMEFDRMDKDDFTYGNSTCTAKALGEDKAAICCSQFFSTLQDLPGIDANAYSTRTLEASNFGECCYAVNQYLQPKAVEFFVRFVYGCLIPSCNILALYFLWRFPIKGTKNCQRTQKLFDKQLSHLSTSQPIQSAAAAAAQVQLTNKIVPAPAHRDTVS